MPKADGISRVRKIALTLDDVEEGTTFGFPCFKVKDRFFAWFPKKKEVEPGTMGAKVTFIERDHRIATRPDVFYLTPHYKDYPSVLARVDKMKDAEIRDLLESAHEFVLAEAKAKKRR